MDFSVHESLLIDGTNTHCMLTKTFVRDGPIDWKECPKLAAECFFLQRKRMENLNFTRVGICLDS